MKRIIINSILLAVMATACMSNANGQFELPCVALERSSHASCLTGVPVLEESGCSHSAGLATPASLANPEREYHAQAVYLFGGPSMERPAGRQLGGGGYVLSRLRCGRRNRAAGRRSCARRQSSADQRDYVQRTCGCSVPGRPNLPC